MVVDQYKNILATSESALGCLAADADRLATFTTAHNYASDLDQLDALLSGRPEAHMFKLARIEYQHSLYSVAFAQYRQAHVSLRLFFELSLCCALFSAHEIDAHLWMKGKKDANWQAIISTDSGVFSKHFVGAFFEGMKEYCDQYRALAEKLYRECSEFVHGNRQSFDGLDAEIGFRPELSDTWADRADTARLVVKFVFLCRYLKVAPAEIRGELENLALDNFGELTSIQALFAEEAT